MNSSIEMEIIDKLGFTPEEFEKRKKFLLLGEKDVELLKEISSLIGEIPDTLFDDFYDHLLSFDETRSILKGPETVERLKAMQKRYFQQLISGNYDYEYLKNRLRVGYRHVEYGIIPMWYIGSFNKYMEGIRHIVKERCDCDLAKYIEYSNALQKIAMLDTVIIMESYNYGKYKLQEKLKKQTVTDPLTGMFNRRKFDQDLADIITHYNRYGTPFCLIVMDLDNFKHVNDEFGHTAGDAVLKFFCQLVQDTLREVDRLYRYGGEEFNVIMYSESIISAQVAAERIRKTVEQAEFPIVGDVTVSIGATQFTAMDTPEEFIKRADTALYEAKRLGKNRVITA
ncbi:diguanylate cyclase [Maridesulfovibrio sp. FT414]|uniref:diguanylate cyclase n=1 Tax=Maridesulfovibrio sp. FT414 TaxID=2979469 RepID=UPI003D80894F